MSNNYKKYQIKKSYQHIMTSKSINMIKKVANITREQIPPPPKLKRQSAISLKTLNEENMEQVLMEVMRFMKNKKLYDENREKENAEVAIEVLRQSIKIPEDTLPIMRIYTAPISPIKRLKKSEWY